MIPRQEVQDAFLSPVSHITRRVEIYEQDGVTPWKQEIWPEILSEGTLSADNSANERRTMDLTLYNPGGIIDPTIGKLWYDKVFKVFYGVHLPRRAGATRVAVIEAPSQESAGRFMEMVAGPEVEVLYRPMARSLADLATFDVLVAISDQENIGHLPLLMQAYAQGISVMTCATMVKWDSIPLLAAGTGPVMPLPGDTVTPVPNSSMPVGQGWTMATGETGRPLGTITPGAEAVLTRGVVPAALVRAQPGEPRWVHLQQTLFGPEHFATPEDRDAAAAFLHSALRWSDVLAFVDHWEMQLGEFVQDSASTSSEDPDAVSVSGRDYVKRCMLSRLVAASTYEKTRSIESVIHTMAINSGIRKIALPATGATLERDMTWEADTSRWDIMKEIATGANYDIYFNHEGVLVMERFRDPSSSPIDLTLDVGQYGNLVSKGLRTSDSQLFNHVVVVGESASSGNNQVPVWGEAINTNPDSPSNVEELGDRVIRHQLPTVATNSKAREVARTMLSVAALEEFELDFSTPLLPWVQPNQILGMSAEAAGQWGPDRFLLSSLSLPLDLSPMSGTGKRIINVT